MTRASQMATTAAVLGAAWLLVLLRILPLPVSDTFLNNVVPVLPFYALIAFGSYALCNIGYNLMVFRECPDEYHSLMNEISEAKDFLRAKGLQIN